MKSIVEHLRQIFSAHSYSIPANFRQATPADVHHAYRLFLNRVPTRAEENYWTALVENRQISLEDLTNEFASGHEFLALQRQRRQAERVEIEGFTMFVRKNDWLIGAGIARTGEYEPQVTACLKELLAPGMVFVDVGANIGYYALLGASLVGEEGQVIAFEPNVDNVALMRRSLAASQVQVVTIHTKAVADRPQTLLLDAGGANSNGRVVEVSPDGFARPSVEAVTLDDTLADLERVDVIKIDTEGAEPLVWAGMQEIAKRHRPTILFEFTPTSPHFSAENTPRRFLADLSERYSLAIVDAPATFLTTNEIMGHFETPTFDHIDLVATPQ